MRYILIFAILLSSLFANYSFTGKNSGKINMHGGKKSQLVEKSNFNNKSLSPFANIDIVKPIKPQVPVKPKKLIKEEKKTK